MPTQTFELRKFPAAFGLGFWNPPRFILSHNAFLEIPSQDGNGRWFRVEAGSAGTSSFPPGLQAADAQVHYWMGHLVLIAGWQAWHFSVPGLNRFLSDAGR